MMDEKTRAVVRAVINERLSKALNAGSGFTFEEEKMIQLGADWGAEAMEEIMREREAKLVAALDQALRQWEMYVTEAAQDDLEKIEHAEAGELRSCKRVLAEHRAAKGEG